MSASDQGGIRVDVLIQLLELTSPARSAIEAAADLPWDQAYDLVTLTPRHARSVLERFLLEDVTDDDLKAWAEALHGRDDVALDEDHRDLLAEFLFQTSTPELFGGLTPDFARGWLHRLEMS